MKSNQYIRLSLLSGNDWNDPEAILFVLLASVYFPTLCEKNVFFFFQKLKIFFFLHCVYMCIEP